MRNGHLYASPSTVAHAPTAGPPPSADDSPQRDVARLIHTAWRMQASDLYLLPGRESVEVAVRQWGEVRPIEQLSADYGRHCITYIKALAGVDIFEKRRPLDGRWHCQCGGQTIDLRISSIPTRFGEDVTLRLLPPADSLPSLEEIGLLPADVARLHTMLASPSGLILLCGPTGSGKTTTLYACLKELHDGTRKINTLEDPIEYSLPGLRQSQVNGRIGLDFVELLTAILRQAPDVIVIGEIRDPATAAVAIRAANSGHLVFATIHAPRAAAAVHSMLALDAQPLFVANCLLGVISQRLVRTLCPHCCGTGGSPVQSKSSRSRETSGVPGTLTSSATARGCRQCAHRGYTGRTGIFELFTVGRELRDKITARASTNQLHSTALAQGMTDFAQAAEQKIAAGTVTCEEVQLAIPAEFLKEDRVNA